MMNVFTDIYRYLRTAGDNFHVVTPGVLYRGAAPDRAMLERLRDDHGVRVIIDLREMAGREPTECRELGLTYVNIPCSDSARIPEFVFDDFLEIVRTLDGAKFVHCAGGRHRTGAMVAAYRVAVEGWTAGRAWDEAKKRGFYRMNGHKPVEESFYGWTATPGAFGARAPERINPFG